MLSTHDALKTSPEEGSDVHAACESGSLPYDADRDERVDSSECAYYFKYEANTVTAGKHTDSLDVHSLAIEVTKVGGPVNRVKANAKRAVVDCREIIEGVVVVSDNADGTATFGGPGTCGTDGKTGVSKPVCEIKSFVSGSRSGS